MFADTRVPHIDWILLGLVGVIPALGLFVLYSAGYDPNTTLQPLSWLPIQFSSAPFVKQLGFFGAGVLIMGFAACIPPAAYHRYAYLLFGLGIVALLGVLLFGSISNGSQRWIAVMGVRFQPAEAVKLAMVLFLARYLSSRPPRKGGYGFREVLVPLSILLVPTLLILRQPDLGTALSLGVVGVSMILFMGIRKRLCILAVVVGIVGAIPAWNMLHPYQQRRVQALFNPESDPHGSGYHIIQSKIAVGSGSLFGKGYLHGSQSQLEFLPEHTTDFIFSVLAEEWGFFGSIFVLVLYLTLLLYLLYICQRSRDLFTALATFGVASLIFFHAVVNIGMVLGLFPVVGLPLPLFSYGGSSLLTILFALGMVLGFRYRRTARIAVAY